LHSVRQIFAAKSISCEAKGENLVGFTPAIHPRSAKKRHFSPAEGGSFTAGMQFPAQIAPINQEKKRSIMDVTLFSAAFYWIVTLSYAR